MSTIPCVKLLPSGDEGLEIWEENGAGEEVTMEMLEVQPEPQLEARGRSKMRGFLKSVAACKKFCHKFEHGAHSCECQSIPQTPEDKAESHAKSLGTTLLTSKAEQK